MYNQFNQNTYQVSSQIQNSFQEMQQMERQNAIQLRQLANQISQIAQHESRATQQIQNLNQLCNQLIQENQRLNNQIMNQQSLSQPNYSQRKFQPGQSPSYNQYQ